MCGLPRTFEDGVRPVNSQYSTFRPLQASLQCCRTRQLSISRSMHALETSNPDATALKISVPGTATIISVAFMST